MRVCEKDTSVVCVFLSKMQSPREWSTANLENGRPLRTDKWNLYCHLLQTTAAFGLYAFKCLIALLCVKLEIVFFVQKGTLTGQ